MAKSVGALFVTLGIQANDYQKGLAAAEKQAKKSMKAISREFQSLDMRGTIIGIAAVGAGFIAAGKKFADAGVEAEKNQREFTAIFGELAKGSGAWVDVFSTAVGRSKDDLQGYMSQFQILLTNMGIGQEAAAGMAQELTRMGVNFASFMGAQDDTMMQAFQVALAGNTRGLREYGIAIKANALDEAAQRAGFKVKAAALMDAQRAQLIYNEILRQTSFAQDDAIKRGGEYDNQVKRLKANIHEAAEEIGSRMLPAMAGMVQELNNWITAAENQKKVEDWARASARGMEEIGKAAAGIAAHRDLVVNAIEGMIGIWAVNKAVKFAGSIGIIIAFIKTLIPLLGAGAAAMTGYGALAVGAVAGAKLRGEQAMESGYQPYTPNAPMGFGSAIPQKMPVAPIKYPAPSIIGSLPDTLGAQNVFGVKPGLFDEFRAQEKAVKDSGDKIVALTEQEQKAITDLQNLGAKVRITAIKDNREKSLAEIDQWYKEEKQKAEGSAAVIVEIEKVKGEKLIAFDAWWTDELTKAATDRAKMLADIQAGLMERAAEKKEGLRQNGFFSFEPVKMEAMQSQQEYSRAAAESGINQKYNLVGTGASDYQARLASFAKEKELTNQQWAWEQEALKRKYIDSAHTEEEVRRGYDIMEKAFQVHNDKIKAIEQDSTQAMIDQSAAFGVYWGDMMTSVVEQAGNSFSNVAKMFSQMIEKMVIKAAVAGLLGYLVGGTAGAKAAASAALGFPSIPGKASGGLVTSPSIIRIAENGPERVLNPIQTREYDRGVGKSIVYHDNSSLTVQITGNAEMLTIADLTTKLNRVVRDRKSVEFEKLRKAVNG